MLMLTALVSLPLAAVLINDVKTDLAADSVTVDIATSDPVATSDIRIAPGGSRRMYVYVDGSAASRSTFGEGASTVYVHPRLRYTKLEIPTADRCGEPYGVVLTESGVRLRATCRNAGAGQRSPVPPAVGRPATVAERPLPDAPQAALARDKQAQSSLRAALALPPEPADDGAGEGERAEAAPSASKAGPGAQVEVKGKEPTRPSQGETDPPKAAKVSPPDAPAAAVVASEGPSVTGKDAEPKSGASAIGSILGGALLLGLGALAVVLTRKRSGRARMIRIVETASIGPRRSLVVARVGTRTMVLGVSEAGVALLDPQLASPPLPGLLEGPPSLAVADATLALSNLARATAPLEAKQPADPDEPKHESSLLARLFQRKPREAEGLNSHDFEQLFSESLEDEELRRKLAMGESGRVA